MLFRKTEPLDELYNETQKSIRMLQEAGYTDVVAPPKRRRERAPTSSAPPKSHSRLWGLTDNVILAAFGYMAARQFGAAEDVAFIVAVIVFMLVR